MTSETTLAGTAAMDDLTNTPDGAGEAASVAALALPTVSVVVPVMNESGNVIPLLEEIDAALSPRGSGTYEILFVDDCSTDDTAAILKGAQARFPALRVIQHDVNCGQSAAIRSGVLMARGKVIATLDGDGQNDPADLPALLDVLFDPDAPESLKMVAGQRRGRKDSATKKMASRLANSIRSKLLKDGVADTGCGLKVFYRDSFLRLPYFDHMHRYFAALMQREGYEVGLVDVSHRPRLHGASKYGVLDRLLVSISDIMGVMWLNRRSRRPGARTEL